MYVVKEDVIKSNVDAIYDAFKKNDVKLMLCYSYKTNMMNDVIRIMSENYVCPEVVSQYEYEHILDSDKSLHRIVCNGVAMSYEELALKVANGEIVNFNDVESMVKVRKIIGDECFHRIGVRIRFDDDSRFGILADDLPKCLERMNELNFDIECLHCHVTATRELSKYRQKVKKMIDVIIDNCIEPEYIDFGGSMYGIMSERLASQFNEVGSFDDYAKIISDEINRLSYKPCVILELGTALIANAVSVVGEIIRIDEYGRIILDIDKYTIGMVRFKNLDYIFIPSGSVKLPLSRSYKVYGCTCIEDDLLIDDFRPDFDPKVGDKIAFRNCGAYSYCFEPEFIIPRQEVMVV